MSGVRKHARKAHSEWLRRVDDASVLRDKSYESKPSTYCIMEEGEGSECGDSVRTEHYAADDDSVRAAPEDDLPGLGAEEPVCLTQEDSPLLRRPLDHEGFGMNRPLSIPSALDLHANVMASVDRTPLTAMAVRGGPAPAPGSREAWASSIAMQLLSNRASLDVDPELAAVSDPICFTPPLVASSHSSALPIYYSPGREGKLGAGDMSPLCLPAVKQARLGHDLPLAHEEPRSSPTPDAEPSSELPNMNEVRASPHTRTPAAPPTPLAIGLRGRQHATGPNSQPLTG